jgi:hypothetical protein
MRKTPEFRTPTTHQSRPEIPEFADQRLGRASLTRGNVGGSHAPGNRIVETALTGWGGRIRTRMAESKSNCFAFKIKARSEKSLKFESISIN